MGLFADILKGLPENAVLRGKVQEAEAENAALQTENAILKDDNRTLKIEIQQLKVEVMNLKDEIQKLTHTDTLADEEIKILVYLADENAIHFRDSMAINLQLKHVRLDYFLEKLKAREYTSWIGGSPVREAIRYFLTSKGREYLFKNDLI
jgi:predicted nuclease with TOPRIM domain